MKKIISCFLVLLALIGASPTPAQAGNRDTITQAATVLRQEHKELKSFKEDIRDFKLPELRALLETYETKDLQGDEEKEHELLNAEIALRETMEKETIRVRKVLFAVAMVFLIIGLMNIFVEWRARNEENVKDENHINDHVEP